MHPRTVEPKHTGLPPRGPDRCPRAPQRGPAARPLSGSQPWGAPAPQPPYRARWALLTFRPLTISAMAIVN